jgi:hypothetical protein
MVKTLGNESSQVLGEKMEAIKVDIGLAGEALNNAMLKGQYRMVYQGYILDMHAQGSSNKDRRRGFRVYFA